MHGLVARDGFEPAVSYAFLHGLKVEHVWLGEYQTWIHFDPQGSIYMECQRPE